MEISGIDIDYGNNIILKFMDGFTPEINPTELKYHLEPNWIWPVIEKIESIEDDHHGYFGVHISSNSCSIQGTNLWKSINGSGYGPVYMSDPNAILNTKLESTWYNIVKFLEWLPYKDFLTEIHNGYVQQE